MNLNHNITLIGLMGAGKTTVGRTLAKRLKRRFVDSDREIEVLTGVRIPVIFELEGEAGFRVRETQMIDALCNEHNLILATGGGAVINPVNRRRLHETSWVVYLRGEPPVLFSRIQHNTTRPLLQGDDPLGTLTALHEQRDVLYREAAHWIIEIGDSVPTMARRIEKEFKTRCAL